MRSGRFSRFQRVVLLAGTIAFACVQTAVIAADEEPDTQDLEEGSEKSGLLIGIMGNRSLEDFKLTRERPLFTPVRHPPLPPPPPPPPPPPKAPKPPKVVEVKPPTPPAVTLIGVLLSDNSKLAIIQKRDRSIQRLAIGEEVDGWSLVKLDSLSIELENRDTRTVYRMFESGDKGSAGFNFGGKDKRKKPWKR